MQSFLAKTLAEKTVASTEGDTHEVIRSVLVDQFYGASPVSYYPQNVKGVKCNFFGDSLAHSIPPHRAGFGT